MKLSDKIQKALIHYIGSSGEIVIPNFYYGYNECDLFRVTNSDFVYEYEIKISRSDFFADAKKMASKITKYELLATAGNHCPNRFYYVMPSGLIEISELPKFAGLLIYNDGYISSVRNPKLLHNRKCEIETYREICKTLSSKSYHQRIKINELRNTDFEKQMNEMERDYNNTIDQNRILSMENLLLKRHGTLKLNSGSK